MTAVTCIRCGTEVEAKRSDTKYCADCKAVVVRENGRRSDKNHKWPCKDCGEVKVDRHHKGSRCRQCDNRYRGQFQRRENNPYWRGGRSMQNGYVTVNIDGKHRREHRVVWEHENGKLPDGYVIHHLNGVKTDNRLENLLAVPRNQHHSEPHKVIEVYARRIQELEEHIKSITQKDGERT